MSFLVLVSGTFLIQFPGITFHLFVPWDVPIYPVGHAALNWSLFVALWLVYVAWIWLVCRNRVGTWTGAGFSIAAIGLAARFLAERFFHVSHYLIFGRPHGRPDPPEFAGIGLALDFGLLAYCVGLTLVVSACITDMRLARTTPRWARFME